MKEIRHELAAAAADLPAGVCSPPATPSATSARPSPPPASTSARSPAQVAAVNLKRLQESLRSLEEYGKLFGPEFGRRVETVRYRAYTLERAVVRGAAVAGSGWPPPGCTSC